jgi:aminomethyltransferase
MISTASQKMPAVPDFGDAGREFEALLSSCGVYDLPGRAKASLSGSDRMRWLNGIVTNNVRDLKPGHGIYAFLLNPQGRILGDLYAYQRGESLLVDTDSAQFEKTLALFDRYIIMDDVEVSDVTDKFSAVGITGPKAREILLEAGFDFPRMQALEFVEVTWKGVPVTIVRHDNPALESYELWAAPESVETLLDALKSCGATRIGTTALNFLRIAEGIPQYGQDIRERDLPQETGQQRALHFTKGCYIGQEIVERIRSRGNVHRRFTGFLVDGPLPTPGAKIAVAGKEVGEVTSSASLPLSGGQYSVALGYIRREVPTDKPIQIDGTKLSVTTLPFAGVFKR